MGHSANSEPLRPDIIAELGRLPKTLKDSHDKICEEIALYRLESSLLAEKVMRSCYANNVLSK